MRLVALVLSSLALLMAAGACGGDDDESAPEPTTSTPDGAAAETSTPDSGLGTVSITVYLARLHEGGLTLAPAQRSIDGGGSLGRAAIEAMIKGPTPDEVEDGFTTAIPSTARVLDIASEDGVVTVNLSEGSFPAAESPNVGLARGQIERTLRQFPGVSRVVIQVEGRPVP